jgi:hypothetical protein
MLADAKRCSRPTLQPIWYLKSYLCKTEIRSADESVKPNPV